MTEPIRAWIDSGPSTPDGTITAELSEHDGMIAIEVSHKHLLINRAGIQHLIAQLSTLDDHLSSRHEQVR